MIPSGGAVAGADAELQSQGVDVAGDRWWRRISPGQVLCSEAAARSAHTDYEIVYEAFASGLDR